MSSSGDNAPTAGGLSAHIDTMRLECLKILADRAQHAERMYCLIEQDVHYLLGRQQGLNNYLTQRLMDSRERMHAVHEHYGVVAGERVLLNFLKEKKEFEEQASSHMDAGMHEEMKLQMWLQEMEQCRIQCSKALEDRKAEVHSTSSQLMEEVSQGISLLSVGEVDALHRVLECYLARFGREEAYLKGIQELQEEEHLAKVAHHKKALCLIELVQGIQHQKVDRKVGVLEAKERLYWEVTPRVTQGEMVALVCGSLTREELKAQVKAMVRMCAGQCQKLQEEEEKYKKEIQILEGVLKAELDTVREKGKDAGKAYDEWKPMLA